VEQGFVFIKRKTLRFRDNIDLFIVDGLASGIEKREAVEQRSLPYRPLNAVPGGKMV
jgi:hypothetical protein